MKAFSTFLVLLSALNAFAAGGTIGSGVTISASGTATDLKYANPRWVDAKAEGTSIALGANAPTLRDVPGNWTTGFESQAYAYAVNDYGSLISKRLMCLLLQMERFLSSIMNHIFTLAHKH